VKSISLFLHLFLFFAVSAFSQTALPTFQATHHNISSSSSCSSSETMMPLPSRSGGHGSTRGYYFIAPIDFCITGVRVPTHNSGCQNISVVRFHNNTNPPSYSGTTNAFDELHLTYYDNSTNKIVVDIQVTAGEVIGIYGYRNQNAYSSSTNPTSTIGGQTVTLYRSGMQYSLTASGMHDIWREVGPISLVEMYYKN